MQALKVELRNAITELHYIIQQREESDLPRLARLQLVGIVGRLERVLLEMESGSPQTVLPKEGAGSP